MRTEHRRVRRRLGEAVAMTLIAEIVDGTRAPGDLLPPEGALSDSFGVSRITTREAVKMLQERGLVTVRQGAGTTISDPDDWNLLDPIVLSEAISSDRSRDLLDELVETRIVLDGHLAEEAARRASPEQRAAIVAHAEGMEAEVTDPPTFLTSDLGFHDLIRRAAGNRLARAMVRNLHLQARAQASYHGNPSVAECRTSNAQHREIARLILAGDGPGAQVAVREHIAWSWRTNRPRQD